MGQGTRTGTYSTRPSSTIFEILTPDRYVESSDDGLMPPTAYHYSWEFFTTPRRSRASFKHPHTSATTWERDGVSTWLHGSKAELCVILSETAADSANMAIPESEKKFRSVKSLQNPVHRGWHCALHLSRSSPHQNCPPLVTGPRTIRAVNRKTWKNKISIFRRNDHSTLPNWPQYIL